MATPVKIVIIGNGFGGIYAMKNLHKAFCNDSNVRISLVGEKNYFLFTPLLHEVATGSINPENIVEPIRKVLGCCLDRFYLGKAETIDLKNKTVEVAGPSTELGIKEKISYDYLVLAPGSETNFYDIPGAREFTFTLKSLEDAIKIKNRCILVLEEAMHVQNQEDRKKKLSFVVVGGGATGVELAAELHEFLIETFSFYYPPEIIQDISVILIHKTRELLPQFDQKLRHKSLEVLKKKGVKVMLSTEVKAVKEKEIILSDDTSIQAKNIIWVAGIKPADLKFEGAIPSSENGRLVVNQYLQLEEYKEVFALGDAAYLKDINGNPVPALAQAAVKEAKAAAKNIKLLVEGREPKPFAYRSSGNLISLGQWMALGEVRGFAFSGRFTWWVWRTVYLFKLISGGKKFKVAIDWTVNLFLPRDISQL